MNGRFEGKVAFVTGGASGLGAAAAQRFSDEGAQVAVADIDGAGRGKAGRELAGRICRTARHLGRPSPLLAA